MLLDGHVRLIGAANMFDLLPDDAAHPATALPEGLEKARSQARALFRALPDSPERSAMLGALGRIGKPVLKRKIRHRAAARDPERGDAFGRADLGMGHDPPGRELGRWRGDLHPAPPLDLLDD